MCYIYFMGIASIGTYQICFTGQMINHPTLTVKEECMKLIIQENLPICTADGYEIDDRLEIVDIIIKERNKD